MSVRRIEPRELKARLEAGEELVLLDVREHDEVVICAVAGSVHVPMGELPRRLSELQSEVPTVCICHHGIRSARVASLLAHHGFRELYNLSGGIDRWAAEVETTMARY